jgi:ribosomal protein S18 acetylase RimI-like enzyme
LGEDLLDDRARPLADRLRGEGAVLCWACRLSTPVAAAAVLPTPGNVGFLLLSPPTAPGVDADALAATAAAAARHALAAGATFVQALIEPDAAAEPEILRQAGLAFVAALIYMRLDLAGAAATPPPDPPGRTWRNGLSFRDAELAAVIGASYEQSLDCPGILGVRRAQDVLAGHRANGIYRPECWWLLCQDGRDAGCILVNDSVAAGGGEVAYMGVAAAFRGRRLGAALLEKAVFQACRRGLRRLSLAVDERNAPALALYRERGFSPTHRRLVWAKIRGKNGLC